MKPIFSAIALSLLTTACTVDLENTGDGTDGRAAGPHPDEYGLVTFWKGATSETALSNCTDSDDWSSVVTAADYVDKYVNYKVTDATSAVEQNCSTTDPSSCADGDDMWTIAGNVFTFVGEPSIIDGDETCKYALGQTWTLTDNGDTAALKIEMQFSADEANSDCDALEQAIKDASDNDTGLIGCTITSDVGMDFKKAG